MPSGLDAGEVPPSVSNGGHFLQPFVTPDNSGLKLLGFGDFGFRFGEISGSAAAEAFFSVVRVPLVLLSMFWCSVAGICKSSWLSRMLCVVVFPVWGVSTGSGPFPSCNVCVASCLCNRIWVTSVWMLHVGSSNSSIERLQLGLRWCDCAWRCSRPLDLFYLAERMVSFVSPQVALWFGAAATLVLVVRFDSIFFSEQSSVPYCAAFLAWRGY